MEIAASFRGDLARDTDHAEAVAAVRRDVDVENLVVEREQLVDRLSDAGILVEEQQARPVLAETELARGAQHAVGRDAANFGSRDDDVAGQHGARPRVPRLHADNDGRCPAYDLAASVAVIDDAYGQLVRTRMRPAFDDVSDDDVIESGPRGRDLVHFEPRRRQLLRETRSVRVDVDPLAQPFEVYSHGRTSGELLEKAQVVLEEQAQIAHAVAQHREPLDAHAERIAAVRFRIHAHVSQNVRVHHAAPQNLEPPPGLRRPDIDLGRRLGEREVRRPETQLHVALEEARNELV